VSEVTIGETIFFPGSFAHQAPPTKCVCVCVCVMGVVVCERKYVCVCVCVCVFGCVCVCLTVSLSVCECLSVCLCVCVCLSERESERDRTHCLWASPILKRGERLVYKLATPPLHSNEGNPTGHKGTSL